MKSMGFEYQIKVPADVARLCKAKKIDPKSIKKSIESEIMEQDCPICKPKKLPKKFTVLINYVFIRKGKKKVLHSPKSFGKRRITTGHLPRDKYSLGYVILKNGGKKKSR